MISAPGHSVGSWCCSSVMAISDSPSGSLSVHYRVIDAQRLTYFCQLAGALCKHSSSSVNDCDLWL